MIQSGRTTCHTKNASQCSLQGWIKSCLSARQFKNSTDSWEILVPPDILWIWFLWWSWWRVSPKDLNSATVRGIRYTKFLLIQYFINIIIYKEVHIEIDIFTNVLLILLIFSRMTMLIVFVFSKRCQYFIGILKNANFSARKHETLL